MSKSQHKTLYGAAMLGLVATLGSMVALPVAEPANAQTSAQSSRPAPRPGPRPAVSSVIYGTHARQRVDIYSPKDAVDDLPVVVFVHGGGWSRGNSRNVQSKPRHFTASNIIFASTGYRLVPSVSVETQAKDIGAAIQAIVGQANAIGVDPERIVLMGHSAGAQLAALVATDPQYAGDAFGAIRGVILLDGAGYDIGKRMTDMRARSRRVYQRAFGNDGARHRSLSPLTHVGGRDAPHWLALYVEERDASRTQSQALMNALIEAGASASALPIEDTDHGRMNRELGTAAGTAQTEAVDAFLETILK